MTTTVNIWNLIRVLNQKLRSSSSLSNTELLQIAKSLELLKSGMVHSVTTVSSLPDAGTSTGELIFVAQTGTLYYSTGSDWVPMSTVSPTTNPGMIWTASCALGPEAGTGRNFGTVSLIREFCSSYDWVTISGKCDRSNALKTNGTLWVWGTAPVGNGLAAISCSPVQEFCSASDWCAASTYGTFNGGAHAAIKTNGSIWTWGCGTAGILGNGNTAGSCSPVREICSASNWCRVSAGPGHVLALKTDGSLWGWGCNQQGQLGIGSTSAGVYNPVRETTAATSWCFIEAGSTLSLGIRTDNTLWLWGNSPSNAVGPLNATPARELTPSSTWCIASTSSCVNVSGIKTDGSLWTWGYNGYGQLGNGNTTNSCSPIREICSATDWCLTSVGNRFIAAIKTNGTLWTWGCGCCGEILNNWTGFNNRRCSPVQEVCRFTDWAIAVAGYRRFKGLRRIPS